MKKVVFLVTLALIVVSVFVAAPKRTFADTEPFVVTEGMYDEFTDSDNLFGTSITENKTIEKYKSEYLAQNVLIEISL